MISQERVIEIYDRANPIKDPKSVIAGTDAAGYLATLAQRSSEVTQLDTRPERTSNRRRGRLLLAAAVAAVLLGMAIVILAQANEEPPAVTNPPVTTLVVPTTEPEATLDPLLEEALSVATAFSEASASGDVETLKSYTTLDGHTLSLLGMVDVPVAETEIAWRDAVGWTITANGCALSNPDVENTNIVCEFTHSSALGEALGVGPYWGRQHLKVQYAGDSKGSVPIDRTIITYGLTVEFPTSTFNTEVGAPFLAWLEANHPEDVETMLDFSHDTNTRIVFFGDGVPTLGAESIELWRQYVSEFDAEQG